jgi:hypothetical protein
MGHRALPNCAWTLGDATGGAVGYLVGEPHQGLQVLSSPPTATHPRHPHCMTPPLWHCSGHVPHSAPPPWYCSGHVPHDERDAHRGEDTTPLHACPSFPYPVGVGQPLPLFSPRSTHPLLTLSRPFLFLSPAPLPPPSGSFGASAIPPSPYPPKVGLSAAAVGKRGLNESLLYAEQREQVGQGDRGREGRRGTVVLMAGGRMNGSSLGVRGEGHL